MRLAALCAAWLVSIPVVAAEEPFIIGSIANRAGGEIVFTTKGNNCASGQRRGYTRGDGGRIDFWFCWVLFGNEFIVVFDDGDRYAYPIADLVLSPEWRAYADDKGGADGRL